ncbi:heat shock protein 21 [Penaeus vannamei]|uniref:Heat shock protein 21 n=1 Tax=Penaeus vannamei TaxID=6689 RepID=A0A3R7LRA4_PENVA|nr:heat shock protein 21 [Penaeus vannamei]
MRLAETLESTVVEKASYDDSVSEQQEQATVQSESDSTEAIKLGEEILPIVRRGSFVQDSFFLDVRQEFDAAIREVLRKWVSEDSEVTHSEDFLGLSHSDILDRYRQLRSRELKEETQVFIVTSDNTSYKLSRDCNHEEEAVDSVGQLNLEETTETKESSPTDTNTSSKTIAEESAEAIESLKGTRRIQRDSPEELLLITKRGNFFQDSFFLDAHRDFSAALRQVLGRCNQDNFEDDTDLRHTDILERYRQLRSRDLREENQAAIVTSDKSCMKIIMDVHDFMSGDVQAKVVDEKELVIEGLVVKKEEGTSSETSHSFRRRFSLPQFTKITSVMSLDGILTVTVMFKLHRETFPITRKGHFFSHYFFRDTREDFQKAVREILSRWGEKSCGDEMTSYRKLRARNMREDTQAFVIDVHDFMDVGEISVKAVNERELVVEGHLEKKEDGSKSSKRFLRRFVVPGDIELEAVISVMSSDGVLKILAPKKEGHNRKHFSIDVEDMDDVEATVSRKFRNGHRLAEEYLKKRDSSSDDEELRAFAKQSNNQYRVTFQDDDEEFEGGHMFNKETKMTSNSSKDFKYNIPSLSMETRVLHIERRGVFAEDYCFANVRNSFSQAVREVLEKASEWTCRSDAMHNYRRLRQRTSSWKIRLLASWTIRTRTRWV